MDSNSISFIYFDVGGVLALDFSKNNKWKQMLEDLGVSGQKRTRFEQLFDKYEPEICIGRAIEEFVAEAQKELDINFPPNYSMTRDFVDRFEPNEGLYNIVEKLSKDYSLGLLTNMYPGMLELIKLKGLLPEVDWDIVVDSSIEGVRKPQEKIFELSEQRAKVRPEQILFIENTQRHIDAAKQRGWNTLLYDPGSLEKSNKDLEAVVYL